MVSGLGQPLLVAAAASTPPPTRARLPPQSGTKSRPKPHSVSPPPVRSRWDEGPTTTSDQAHRARSPFGPRGGPLNRRSSFRGHFSRWAPGTNPLFEFSNFQLGKVVYCKGDGCGKELTKEEQAHQTGLCDKCYDHSEKECQICKRVLHVKALWRQSDLCSACYEKCEKTCRFCSVSLAKEQLFWNTGLCDRCWDSWRSCNLCKRRMETQEIEWGSGLCDDCYGEVVKICRICHHAIPLKELQYGSGMCNSCYNEHGKHCKVCRQELRLGLAHWRSRMCDSCFAKADKTCDKCGTAVEGNQPQWATTHKCMACYNQYKEGKCGMCSKPVNSREKFWGTGLCDDCYDRTQKKCHLCGAHMHFGDRRWGSGLCNRCYDGSATQCVKCLKRIPLTQLRWGSQLCDNCYTTANKVCTSCGGNIALGSLYYGTGKCDTCFDGTKSTSPSVTVHKGLSRGVWAVIMAQFVYYASPGMIQPSLYLQAEAEHYPPSPAAAFAVVLMTANFAAMVAPVPLGLWADRRGERQVYCGVSILGILTSAAMLVHLPLALFASAWAGMNVPPAIRGVRAAYFAKNVDPEDLSRAGNLASCLGLLGGFTGPLVSVLVNKVFDGEEPEGVLVSFRISALVSGVFFALCLLGVLWTLGGLRVRPQTGGGRKFSEFNEVQICERCDRELTAEELLFQPGICEKCVSRTCERCCRAFTEDELSKQVENTTALCDYCWDHFGGYNKSWKQFKKEVLVSFCMVSILLEFGMNAAVIATFQPLAVGRFGWGNNAIAFVNFAGAGLSVFISLLMAYLRLPERVQMALATGLYFGGVFIYAMPPLSEWRLVLGLMLGIKAQILFMAPFTAIFSRLIGGIRVTNNLSTCLCLAPAIGAAAGTAVAPAFVRVADTLLALLFVIPSTLASAFIVVRWDWLKEGNKANLPAGGPGAVR